MGWLQALGLLGLWRLRRLLLVLGLLPLLLEQTRSDEDDR
jgi:hypothetical protein